MIKKTITYKTYDGEEVTNDFYFNLNKAELLEWECSYSGGLSKTIEKMSAERDSTKLVPVVKDLVLKAYGEKSLDGKRFIKTPEITAAFTQTEAYAELFMELATNADAAAEFIEGVTNTKELQKQLPQKSQMTVPDKQ